MKKNIKYIFGVFVAIVVAAYLFWINRPAGTPMTLNDSDDNAGALAPSGASTTSYLFASNLGFGSMGAEVTALQKILIDQGYLTAVSSPTGYFGPFTKAALAAFQAKNNIAIATGYFGTQTRAFINSTDAAAEYKDGTYTGTVADAVYGKLQLTVTISGGKITAVSWPVYPNTPGHTSQVSATALPTLEQEAIVAQSANVNIVSGATQDSAAFQESLKAALAQAQS